MAAKKAGRKKAARKKAGARKKTGAKKKAPAITIHGTKPNKGERMTGTTGWRLAATKGKKRIFAGTLLKTLNKGDIRIAIFSVPK